MTCLTTDALAAALDVPDLTDPAQGRHAIQLLVDEILSALGPPLVHRGSRIVSVADNYDRLGYTASAAARDARHTRYVGGGRMLRSQTSALVPGALRRLASAGAANALLACPGVVYRRDAIDRLHTGTPHQLDVWRIADASPPSPRRAELLELVEVAVGAALPGVPWRTRPADHPYTTDGLEIEARSGDTWVEIGECGVAARHVLAGAGLPTGTWGLALGLGLDRLLMLRKGIDDIRLLRSTDPRVASQLADLSPYRPVSAQPAAHRDLSIVARPGVTAEDLGDRVREILGPDADLVEEVAILSRTEAAALPAASRSRLGIRDGEENVLLRVILRDLHRALPKRMANDLRDRLWTGLMDRPDSADPVG
jgi:phenylalanyl-tRNA synthetase alpha chain